MKRFFCLILLCLFCAGCADAPAASDYPVGTADASCSSGGARSSPPPREGAR